MASLICAIAAIVCFVLALFGVAVGADLAVLGLLFLALWAMFRSLPLARDRRF